MRSFQDKEASRVRETEFSEVPPQKSQHSYNKIYEALDV